MHGWGAYSPEALIYATSTPAQPAVATTAEANEDVEIAWSEPFNNYESTDAYRVAIRTSAGSFEEDTDYCDASTADVMEEAACRIPVSVLTAAPFSLTAGDLVVVVVQAHNARGWGPLSEENTAGAVIITVPHQMAAPVRYDASTDT